MRCISCGALSFGVLCTACKDGIKPHFSKRELKRDFFVYSFFGYNEISPFLHTKHHPCGVSIYKFLAKKAFIPFFEKLDLQDITLIPIDDKTKGGYSHTALLVKSIKSKNIKPIFGALRAKNGVSYSGKSLSYRKSHPREFTCKLKDINDVILVDDLVTTGTTLLEALHAMKKSNINVLFALTLADAKVK